MLTEHAVAHHRHLLLLLRLLFGIELLLILHAHPCTQLHRLATRRHRVQVGRLVAQAGKCGVQCQTAGRRRAPSSGLLSSQAPRLRRWPRRQPWCRRLRGVGVLWRLRMDLCAGSERKRRSLCWSAGGPRLLCCSSPCRLGTDEQTSRRCVATQATRWRIFRCQGDDERRSTNGGTTHAWQHRGGRRRTQKV